LDNNLIAAIITASGAVLAAAVGAIVGRSEFWDRLFAKRAFPRLAGTRWASSWTDRVGDDKVDRTEIFEFTSQKRGRVYGHIIMDRFPELKWDIAGDYNDRFLRLFWHPSADAKNKFFLDYGCYFFERKGMGSFEGYAVGFDHETSAMEVAEHRLRQLPN
jgi:hypothetical protein